MPSHCILGASLPLTVLASMTPPQKEPEGVPKNLPFVEEGVWLERPAHVFYADMTLWPAHSFAPLPALECCRNRLSSRTMRRGLKWKDLPALAG